MPAPIAVIAVAFTNFAGAVSKRPFRSETRAEPASQALGITNALCRRCKSRNVRSLSAGPIIHVSKRLAITSRLERIGNRFVKSINARARHRLSAQPPASATVNGDQPPKLAPMRMRGDERRKVASHDRTDKPQIRPTSAGLRPCGATVDAVSSRRPPVARPGARWSTRPRPRRAPPRRSHDRACTS